MQVFSTAEEVEHAPLVCQPGDKADFVLRLVNRKNLPAFFSTNKSANLLLSGKLLERIAQLALGRCASRRNRLSIDRVQPAILLRLQEPRPRLIVRRFALVEFSLPYDSRHNFVYLLVLEQHVVGDARAVCLLCPWQRQPDTL